MFIPIHDHNPRRYVRNQYVTWSLIALNLATFLLVQGGGTHVEAAAVRFGAIPALIGGQGLAPYELADTLPPYLTLVTYAFLHADWLHLGGNMLFLWVFGDNVEDALGHLRFLVFYLLCAIAAALAHVAMAPGSPVPMIGASGAVAGILGAYLLLHPKARVWIVLIGRIPLRVPAYLALGAWIALQVFSALSAEDEGIAWWGHLGGLLAGIVLVVPLRRSGVALFDRRAD